MVNPICTTTIWIDRATEIWIQVDQRWRPSSTFNTEKFSTGTPIDKLNFIIWVFSFFLFFCLQRFHRACFYICLLHPSVCISNRYGLGINIKRYYYWGLVWLYRLRIRMSGFGLWYLKLFFVYFWTIFLVFYLKLQSNSIE